MNRKLIIAVVLVSFGLSSHAQLKVGNGGLYIKSGAIVVLDRLHLQPTQDIDIQNNTLSVSHTPAPGNPTASIARVYQWSDTLRTKGLVGIYVVPSELNGNNFDFLQLAFNPTNDPNDYVVSNQSVTFSSNNFLFETMATTTWKQLTAVESGSVLPLHLFSFTAIRQSNSCWLQWKVAGEENVKDYTVERSSDGKIYEAIGTREAQCNGCESEADYQFEDREPVSGHNYYRLLMSDWDGRYSYSNIVQLYFDPFAAAITASPNPVTTNLTLSGLHPAATYQLQVMSAEGKIVYAKTITPKGNSFVVKASAWASGTYFIWLSGKEHSACYLKINKQ